MNTNSINFTYLMQNGERLARTPEPGRFFWFNCSNKQEYVLDVTAIGYRWDGYVYFIRPADESLVKHPEWPHLWFNNSSWWCVRYPEDDFTKELLSSLIPDWLDIELAKQILMCAYSEIDSIPAIKDGRYYNEHSGDMATNQKDMLWVMKNEVQYGLNYVHFTPGIKLLYNNGENQFTGHPLQIWDDGKWSRGHFFRSADKITAELKEANDIIKHIKKADALAIGVEKILNMTWCNKHEIAWLEGHQNGFFYQYNEEYRAELWETSTGNYYMLFHEWGSYNGEGDAGDDASVFLTLDELKSEFLRRTETQRRLG